MIKEHERGQSVPKQGKHMIKQNNPKVDVKIINQKDNKVTSKDILFDTEPNSSSFATQDKIQTNKSVKLNQVADNQKLEKNTPISINDDIDKFEDPSKLLDNINYEEESPSLSV